jgi:hypothetical protein
MWLTGGVYHDWATFLERWSSGDSGDSGGIGGLPRVDPEELNAETLVRLAHRIVDAMTKRLQTWCDLLTRAIAAAPDEFSAGRALAQARTGLRSVRALADHPSLPAELRDRLQEMVDRQVVAAQQMLEDDLARMSAGSADPRLVESRRRTIRDNPLTAVFNDTAASHCRPADWFLDPAAPTHRRIIIDQ